MHCLARNLLVLQHLNHRLFRSLGCTIVELLTGKPPYYDFDQMAALFRIVQDDCPPLPEGISPACKDFLMQCFQKEPILRKSAATLLSHKWIKAHRRREVCCVRKSV